MISTQIDPDDPNIKEKDASDYTSFTYIQFYEGIFMAIDSLKKKGFSAKFMYMMWMKIALQPQNS